MNAVTSGGKRHLKESMLKILTFVEGRQRKEHHPRSWGSRTLHPRDTVK